MLLGLLRLLIVRLVVSVNVISVAAIRGIWVTAWLACVILGVVINGGLVWHLRDSGGATSRGHGGSGCRRCSSRSRRRVALIVAGVVR